MRYIVEAKSRITNGKHPDKRIVIQATSESMARKEAKQELGKDYKIVKISQE